MSGETESAYWKQVFDGMIDRSVTGAPTEPGVYRLPCGECYVDFFIGPDGSEHWLVPGDPAEYTRESVAATRHGEHAWERMYTLDTAAVEIRRRAKEHGVDPAVLLTELAASVDEADAAEEAEIAQIVLERTASGESAPLADVARRFGIDLDELMGRDE